jgi:hypothetical protein
MAVNRFIEVIREGGVGDVSPKRVARAMGHLRSAGRERIGTRGPAELAQGKITSFEGHAILGDGASVAAAPEIVGESGDCGDTTLAAEVAVNPRIAQGYKRLLCEKPG